MSLPGGRFKFVELSELRTTISKSRSPFLANIFKLIWQNSVDVVISDDGGDCVDVAVWCRGSEPHRGQNLSLPLHSVLHNPG